MPRPTVVRSRSRPALRRPVGASHPRPWRALRRALSWHRRPLAAVAAALAVLTGWSAAVPEGPPRVDVLVAVREVPGGSVLTEADVGVRSRVADELPAGALRSPADVLGRAVSAALAEGQVVTPLALAAPRASPAGGRVVAPVRVSDAELVALLRPGDVVDLLGADQEGGGAAVVARAARVVTVPQVTAGATTGSTGGLVLVEVAAGTATDLAKAAVAGPLSLTWR